MLLAHLRIPSKLKSARPGPSRFFTLTLLLGSFAANSALAGIVYRTYYADQNETTLVETGSRVFREIEYMSGIGLVGIQGDNEIYTSLDNYSNNWAAGTDGLSVTSDRIVDLAAITGGIGPPFYFVAENATQGITSGPNGAFLQGAVPYVEIERAPGGGTWWGITPDGNVVNSQTSYTTNFTPNLSEKIVGITPIDDSAAYATTESGDLYFINGPGSLQLFDNPLFIDNTLELDFKVENGLREFWLATLDGGLYAGFAGLSGNNGTRYGFDYSRDAIGDVVSIGAIDATRTYFVTSEVIGTSVQAVPAPATLALLGLGLLGLRLRGRS